MQTGFKPLLAAKADVSNLDYTDMWLSPKLDGIRAIVTDGVVLSRSLKPIPNKHIQRMFRHLEYYDGELICGIPTARDVYRVTNSGCMTVNGEPDVAFYVFDHIFDVDADYVNRNLRLEYSENVVVVPQDPIKDRYDLEVLEGCYLDQGYEGVMLRRARGENSKYRFGRSTAKSQTLLKLKRFSEDDFLVVDFEERFHNANPATINALGHTERSMHVENMIGRGDLGALVLETNEGKRFTCGSGFDDATRREIWGNKEKYVGRWAKVKHFPVGVKTLPRFPTFLGFRDENDMS